MCFMLFAGTDEPLPLKEWRKQKPDIWVRPVGKNEAGIRVHFSKSVVQYVGSTAGCGCDFPHWILYNGKEPDTSIEETDPAQAATDQYNRQALATLLESFGKVSVELYGVWDGNWAKSPRRMEDISIGRMRGNSFLLGEEVFYRVQL